MAEQPSVAALSAFVNQLNDMVKLAGSPSLSDLRKMSQSGRRVLAESTTHDILTGKRKRVPEWAWVSSFVAACKLAAEQTGLDAHALGDTQTWHQRWLVAREAQPDPSDTSPATPPTRPAEAQPILTPAPPPSLPPSSLPPPPLLPPSSLLPSPSLPTPPPSPPTPPWPSRRLTAPVVINKPETGNASTPPTERERQLQVYGRIGTRLLHQGHPGDGPQCMRLAVITLLKGWPEVARHWLRRASDAGHCEAPELFNHPQRQQAAAELAYGYGCHYQSAQLGQLSFAMFFFRLAGDNGHAEAAYQLALAHRGKGEHWAAAAWFRRAALNGHPRAATEFDDASEHFSQTQWHIHEVDLIEEPPTR